MIELLHCCYYAGIQTKSRLSMIILATDAGCASCKEKFLNVVTNRPLRSLNAFKKVPLKKVLLRLSRTLWAFIKWGIQAQNLQSPCISTARRFKLAGSGSMKTESPADHSSATIQNMERSLSEKRSLAWLFLGFEYKV